MIKIYMREIRVITPSVIPDLAQYLGSLGIALDPNPSKPYKQSTFKVGQGPT